MHGKEGRRLMLATAAELKARNVTLDELRLYARRVYGDKYDPKRTAEEWKNVDEKKTWRCDTIQEKYPEDYPEVKICRAIFGELQSKKEKVVFTFDIKFRDGIGIDTQDIIYWFVGEWNDLAIYEKIAEIID